MTNVTSCARHLATLVALTFPFPALAQSGPPASSTNTCELHVYPAGNELASIQGAVSLLGLPFNLIDAASHDKSATRVKERMTADLSPAGQIEVLTDSEVIIALKLPTNTTVVAEAAIPSYAQLKSDAVQKARFAALNAAVHEQRRLTTSTTPCYAELIASNLFIQRAPLFGTLLSVRWYYRNLGANPKLKPYYDGWSEVEMRGYTSATSEQTESARIALRQAFLASLVKWAAVNLEKRAEPEHRPANPPGH